MVADDTNTPGAALSVEEIAAIFNRHRGSRAGVARSLGIHPQNITDWFRGRGRSRAVDAAIRRRAQELLALEQRNQSVSEE